MAEEWVEMGVAKSDIVLGLGIFQSSESNSSRTRTPVSVSLQGSIERPCSQVKV